MPNDPSPISVHTQVHSASSGPTIRRNNCLQSIGKLFHSLVFLFLVLSTLPKLLGDLHQMHSFLFLGSFGSCWVKRDTSVCSVENWFPSRIDVSCDTGGDSPSTLWPFPAEGTRRSPCRSSPCRTAGQGFTQTAN